MPSTDIPAAILAFLARYPGEQFRSKEIARRLGYRSAHEYELFQRALASLKESGEVQRVKGKKVQHLHVPQSVTGELRMTRQGFGFVVPDDGSPDVFVAGRNTNQATHGDLVEVSLYVQKKGTKGEEAKRDGEVTRIIRRGRTEIVGTVERVRKNTFVVPDDTRIASSVVVARDDLNGAVPGDKVVVAIESWGDAHFHPEGKVREVLGKAGSVPVELMSVAREFRLPMAFPPEVAEAAAAFPDTIPDDVIAKRRDLRTLRTITIDPVDAKDFDDALSLEPLHAGNVRLGVHIADVSSYATEGSPVDVEAARRGTSVYFPNGVIPMIPERLSGKLCSLMPGVDRLAFSVFMTVSPKGAVSDVDVTESVIHSKRRYTYEEVQTILDGGSDAPKGEDPANVDLLRKLRDLSAMLTKKRMKEGSVDFDSPEAAFTYDDEGLPVSIRKKERLASHRLVEECMLLANQVVAKQFGFPKREENIRPFLFRVHDLPDPAKIAELATFVGTFGYKLHVDGNVRSRDLQRLLEQVKGSDVEVLINEVAIRSMAKAEYSEKNAGHYGLAFDAYTHFTSPIRRYPDLVVHRLIKEYIRGMSYDRRQEHAKKLPGIAAHSSQMERNAMEAERAAVKIMQVEYMKRHLGDEFSAVISGVTRFGMFVEIDEMLVEGMVHVRNLDDDYYTYDERHYTLIGQRTGRRFRLGDRLRVQVTGVDPEERRIDFRVADDGEDRKRKAARRGRR